MKRFLYELCVISACSEIMGMEMSLDRVMKSDHGGSASRMVLMSGSSGNPSPPKAVLPKFDLLKFCFKDESIKEIFI